MTFTIVGVCQRTGKLGVCKATGTPAGGGRSFVVVQGKGALTIQAHTDFRLMELGSKLLGLGYAPGKVLREMQDSDRYAEYRQIVVVDTRGETAGFSGPKGKGWCGHVVGKNAVACGNGVVGEPVVQAMIDAFEASEEEELEERLLRASEAGDAAGGQPDGQTSAALLVHHRYDFPIVNLRVDVAKDPVADLRRIFDWYRPLIPYYIARNQDPTAVGHRNEVLESHGMPVRLFA
jgi:uncharacterized Ntn-hydrolase superfamily protein